MTHQTFPKPVRGSYLRERRESRRAVEAAEKANKAKVRARDRGCRWPGCECRRLKLPTEVAHLEDKGMGGDHGERSDPSNMIELCVERHRGTPSLHSGDLRIEPKTSDGANGPCDFYARSGSGRMEMVASERYVGVSVTRT